MAKPERNIVLGPHRVRQAEYERREWVANVPNETILSDLEREDFWSAHCNKLRGYDRIEVRIEDMSWVAECIVIEADRTWAMVRILTVHELKDTEVTAPEMKAYEVKHKGPEKRWCVISRETGQIIRGKFTRFEEAMNFATAHERKVRK